MKLLDGIVRLDKRVDRSVRGLADDSRRVNLDYIFFAVPGVKTDGRAHIEDAIAQGAKLVLCEAEGFYPEGTLQERHGVPTLSVSALTEKIGLIASRFYQYPSQELFLLGVTGTNGKTSCTHFFAAALEHLGEQCGVVGTLGNGFYGKLANSHYTTPDAIEVHRLMRQFKQEGAHAVAMEVSSHGLSQGRVNGCEFDVAIFTNLTHDHLDYHQTMENYGMAKRRLFHLPALRYAVINLDDAFSQRILQDLPTSVIPFGYSLEARETSIPTAAIQTVTYTPEGIQAEVKTPWGEGCLKTRLWGDFNLSNLLAVLAALCLKGIEFTQALAVLSTVSNVPGRMELFQRAGKARVLVDYSHTPDALEKALQTIRQHCQGKIWCVFGCGGDRDRQKRPIMAKIAENQADFLIVTDDNPRHEDPERIVTDILQGLSDKRPSVVIHDRRSAITEALRRAHADDVILIAGKGHEDYQIVGSTRLPFSDRQQVKELLSC